ncbi:tyrosine-type recombinase/integrase [Paraburkholderia oxyphila]|uniref:tyrosine-type recombinase/integrase n=1 Tax=Paraburkholderia oxyphila TaxID=614212 RepID=UPI0006938C36|nr:integrase arm-type DNA-binding domain-containing protein [Paraburkholderia oxyphila]
MPMLTDRALRNLKPDDGPLTDSQVPGLMIRPNANGGKWALRYVSPTTRKRREMGLGVYPATSLRDARVRALAMRSQIDSGHDPIQERRREQVITERAANVPTFLQAAEKTHEKAKSGWKHADGRNARRWLSSVKMHLAPLLECRVDTLKPRDFSDTLASAWIECPRVADNVFQRASAIMEWAFAAYPEHVMCNPVPSARALLPSRSARQSKPKHHPAIQHTDAPAFVRTYLAGIEPHEVTRACTFVLLHTAVRPAEARGMEWGELDLDRARWLIPAERMKGGVEHDVPLVPEVVSLLRAMRETKMHERYVFPNVTNTGPLSDVDLQTFFRETGVVSDTSGRTPVPHGCRACFRGWVDAKGYDPRLGERQLAHRPRGETAVAYQRDTMFERRAILMGAWTNYLHGRPAAGDNVIPLNVSAAA